MIEVWSLASDQHAGLEQAYNFYFLKLADRPIGD